jgi:hypothetical protein
MACQQATFNGAMTGIHHQEPRHKHRATSDPEDHANLAAPFHSMIWNSANRRRPVQWTVSSCDSKGFTEGALRLTFRTKEYKMRTNQMALRAMLGGA